VPEEPGGERQAEPEGAGRRPRVVPHHDQRGAAAAVRAAVLDAQPAADALQVVGGVLPAALQAVVVATVQWLQADVAL